MKPVEPFINKILKWHKYNNRPLPWRKEMTPYKAFIAGVMLQRTTVIQVAPVFEQFISSYPDIESVARSRESKLLRLMKPMGIPRRAKMLKLAAKTIMRDYNGEVPADESILLSLPGVGPYTAAVVQIVGFSSPARPIDTNIDRLFKRYFGARKSVSIETLSKKAFNAKRPYLILFAIMDFSALVCDAKHPSHEICPLKKNCSYYNRNVRSKTPIETQ